MSEPKIIDLNKAPTNSPDQVIAIDFDGVITDPHKAKADAFTAAGYDLSPTETSRRYCVEKKGIPEETYEKIVRDININKLNQIPLREGVREGLEIFTNAGYCPIVVTSRYDEEVGPMLQYIRKNDLDIYGYINTNRMPKRRSIAGLSPKIFIDDSQKKLKPILEEKSNNVCLFYFKNNGNIQTNMTISDIRIVDNWYNFVRWTLYMSRYIK